MSSHASGVLRAAVVLSLGWTGLAVVVATMSSAVAGDDRPRQLGPSVSKAVYLAEIDPCTYAPIVIDGLVMATESSTVESTMVRTEGLISLTGSVQANPSQQMQPLVAEHSFAFRHAVEPGITEPVDARLPIVGHADQPTTILVVKGRADWDGSQMSLRITDVFVACAVVPGSDDSEMHND